VDSFSRRISSALELDRSSDSADAIKAAVTNELQSLDPRLVIVPTDYFNHSFVPDLVATWPDTADKAERYIYLKFNSDLGYLFDDISLVQDKHPIIFGLAPMARQEPAELSKITEVARRHDTLVTDPRGIQTLVEKRSGRFLELVSTVFTQGGRGLLDEPAAAVTVDVLDAGYEGARTTRAEQTKRASDVAEELFTYSHAGKIIRLLQAVWVGSGGHLEDFPGRRELGNEVPDDALQFLLQLDEIRDDDFWYRIGRQLTVAQLSRLSLPAGSPNLDRLMQVSAGLYWARWCRVKSHARVNIGNLDPKWTASEGVLILGGPDYSAYVSENATGAVAVPREQSNGISIDELLSRSDDLMLNELEFSSGGRVLKYAAVGATENIGHDEALHFLEGSLPGAHVVVQRAGITLQNGRHLSCNFLDNTATGRTASKVKLVELVETAITLFRPASERDREPFSFNIPSEDEYGQLSLDIGWLSD
jgi:hypothetical protein